MSLEAKIKALSAAVTENNELRRGLEPLLRVSPAPSKSVAPSEGALAKEVFSQRTASEVELESLASASSQTAGNNAGRMSNPNWGHQDRISDAVLRALVDTYLMFDDDTELSMPQVTLKQLLRANGVTFFSEMGIEQRAAAKEAMQMLLSGQDLARQDVMRDRLTMPPGAANNAVGMSNPNWGQEDRISDAVLRALVDTCLMFEDETELSIAQDTLKQLLRANAVTFFSEMDSEQRAVAKEAMQMLLSKQDYALKDFMLDMLTMPPGDDREEAWEF